MKHSDDRLTEIERKLDLILSILGHNANPQSVVAIRGEVNKLLNKQSVKKTLKVATITGKSLRRVKDD